MRYALALLAAVAAVSLAGSHFSGGCAEVFGISGYAKAWFYMDGEEGADPEHAFRAYNWTGFKGRLNSNTFAYLGTDFASEGGNPALHVREAYLKMDIMPELSVTAGQFKIPLVYAFNRSGGRLYFLHRAYMTTTDEFDLYGGRDVGVSLHAQYDWVGIDLGIFNGTRIYNDAENGYNKQIVAKLTLDPTEWLTVAGGMNMIGMADDEALEGDDSWSAMGINAYALVDYPVSDNTDLIFVGELLHAGCPGPDVEGVDAKDGLLFYATLGARFSLENAIISGIMPAVRLEMIDPHDPAGGDDEDNETVIDAALNLYINPHNNLQIGLRNYSYEADVDGHMDMYLGWTLNF